MENNQSCNQPVLSVEVGSYGRRGSVSSLFVFTGIAKAASAGRSSVLVCLLFSIGISLCSSRFLVHNKNVLSLNMHINYRVPEQRELHTVMNSGLAQPRKGAAPRLPNETVVTKRQFREGPDSHPLAHNLASVLFILHDVQVHP